MTTNEESYARGEGRVLVRGGSAPGTILGPDAAPLIARPKPPKQEARLLRVGDVVRALGVVYSVRKVTKKDVVMRPAKKGRS